MAMEPEKGGKTAEAVEKKEERTQTLKKGRKMPQEPRYPASELAANAGKVFGTRQECVAAALTAAGKTECTVTEAKSVVEMFMEREVR